MPDKPDKTKQKNLADELRRQAEQKQPGLISEFVDFVLHNKKWWLIPILLVLLLLGLLVLLSGSGAAPLMYPFF